MDGYKTRYSQENTLGSEGKMKIKHITYNKTNKYGLTHRTLLLDFGRKLIGFGCELTVETFNDKSHNPLVTLDRLLRIGPFVYTRKVQVAPKWMRTENELHYTHNY